MASSQFLNNFATEKHLHPDDDNVPYFITELSGTITVYLPNNIPNSFQSEFTTIASCSITFQGFNGAVVGGQSGTPNGSFTISPSAGSIVKVIGVQGINPNLPTVWYIFEYALAGAAPANSRTMPNTTTSDIITSADSGAVIVYNNGSQNVTVNLLHTQATITSATVVALGTGTVQLLADASAFCNGDQNGYVNCVADVPYQVSMNYNPNGLAARWTVK
jgi:hypothetical protein